MANITNYLNKIKTAVYGKDVRGAIHDAIKQVYDDASVNHDNANMEVKMARGTHNTLNDRLDNVDEIQAQTNAQLSHISLYANNEEELISALNNSAWNKNIYLKNGAVYRMSQKITFQTNKGRVHLHGNNATIEFQTVDGGFDLTSESSNNGDHIIENLFLVGTNKQYPSTNSDMSSVGTGIKLENNVGVVINNVVVRCFEVGLELKNCIGTNVLGCSSFVFNKKGIVLSGYSNTNKFYGTRVRENRQVGVHFDSSQSPAPTNNCFFGCYIESNIPYNTSYDIEGIGVLISRGYDNIFDGIYSENHKYSIVLEDYSSGNKFSSYRFNRNTYGNEMIVFKGANINNNIFSKCIGALDYTQKNVEATLTTSYNNKFEDCHGINLSGVYNILEVTNCCDVSDVSKNIGNLKIDASGVRTFMTVSENDGAGNYNPTTKKINVFGTSALMIGSTLTTNIEVVDFEETLKNSFLIITNYQKGYTITIKSDLRYGKLITNNNDDCILKEYNDCIIFYINNLGKAVEVSRNLNTPSRPVINTKSIITYDFTSTIYSGESKDFDIMIENIGAYSNINLNFTSALPVGLIYQVYNLSAGKIRLRFVNVSDAVVSLGTRSFSYTFIN